MFADACLCAGSVWTVVLACNSMHRVDKEGDIAEAKSMTQSNLWKTFTHSLSEHDRTYPDSQIHSRLNNVEGDSCQAVDISCARLTLNGTLRWHINHYIYIFCRGFIRIDNFNLSSEKQTAQLILACFFCMKHPHTCLADIHSICWRGWFHWRVKIMQYSSHCSHLPLHQKWFQIYNMGACFWSWWYMVTWQLGCSSIQTPRFRCLWCERGQKQKHVSDHTHKKASDGKDITDITHHFL